jgi:hypothetical protein
VWHLGLSSSHQCRQIPQRIACRLPGIQALQPQAEGCAEVNKLLENKHLEQDQRINPLAPCIAFELLRGTPFMKWTE